MHIPQIRIKDAWLLRQEVSENLNKLWGEGEPLRSDEEYAEITKQYHDAWKPHEEEILTHISEILELEFRQELIDVYIAPWFLAFSDPLVIGTSLEPDAFIDILTHELIHRLLTDNEGVDSDYEIGNEWEKLFGKDHTFNTLVHIPVHAVHKSVYLDLLKSTYRLERDINMNKKNNAVDYLSSWEYVNANDYKDIIKNLKYNFKDLKN